MAAGGLHVQPDVELRRVEQAEHGDVAKTILPSAVGGAGRAVLSSPRAIDAIAIPANANQLRRAAAQCVGLISTILAARSLPKGLYQFSFYVLLRHLDAMPF
jgi:hypothetical protein